MNPKLREALDTLTTKLRVAAQEPGIAKDWQYLLAGVVAAIEALDLELKQVTDERDTLFVAAVNLQSTIDRIRFEVDTHGANYIAAMAAAKAQRESVDAPVSKL